MPVKHDTKDKKDTNNDHSEHAHNIPKPRMTKHDRPTQSGTDSKAQQHKPSAHYETAHNLRTEAAKKNRKRSTFFCFRLELHTRRKKHPYVLTTTWSIQIDTIVKDKSKSSVHFALFVAGFNGVPVHICWNGLSVVCWFNFSNKGGEY